MPCELKSLCTCKTLSHFEACSHWTEPREQVMRKQYKPAELAAAIDVLQKVPYDGDSTFTETEARAIVLELYKLGFRIVHVNGGAE